MQSSFPFLSDIAIFLPSWSPLSLEDLSIISLPGCSNQTFKLSLPNPDHHPEILPRSLIYRRFGNLTDFIDYQSESLIFKELGDRAIGPKCYGSTESYRLEETLEGAHPDRKAMLEDSFIDSMASLTRGFHSLSLLPRQSPIFKDFLLSEDRAQALPKIRSLLSKDTLSDPLQKSLQAFCSEEEVAFMAKTLPKSPQSLAFCHNDLNPMNIFLRRSQSGSISLRLIDFEYSGLNYRGFDIAGFFIELAYDYSGFPGFEFRPELLASEGTVRRFLKGYMPEGTGEELEELRQEVRIGMLQWLFFTGLWCVYQKAVSKVQFDFLAMAEDKFRLYKKLKEELFSNF